MKLIVDGQCFQTLSALRGIGRYTFDFLNALTTNIPNLELVICLNANITEPLIYARQKLINDLPGCKVDYFRGLSSSHENQKGWNSERKADEKIFCQKINSLGGDCFLNPSPFEGSDSLAVPISDATKIKIPSIAIFHDAIPLRFPSTYLTNQSVKETYIRRIKSYQTYSHIVTLSEFCKSEYQDIFNRNNCSAIGAGLSADFEKNLKFYSSENDEVLDNLGSYLLYVGGFDKRKNIAWLIRSLASSELFREHLSLVLVGANSENVVKRYSDMMERYAGKPSKIFSFSWVDDKKLVSLHKKAVAVIQPSVMEGFGLGALEAFASQVPYISADNGGATEVVANGDLLFENGNSVEMLSILHRIIVSKKYANKFIENGNIQIQKFTWEQVSRNFLEVFNDLENKASSEKVTTIDIITDRPRLIFDVTSTILSEAKTGIQRVINQYAKSLPFIDDKIEVVKCFFRQKRAYRVDEVSPDNIQLSPENIILPQRNDILVLYDSTWENFHEQEEFISEQSILGNEIIFGVHDLEPLINPAFTSKNMPLVFSSWFNFVLSKATGVITPSKTIANEVYDIIAELSFDKEIKFYYLHHGSNFSEFSSKFNELQYQKNRTTFLMLGTIEPRKGHATVLNAFNSLWLNNEEVNLLLVGEYGWGNNILKHEILGNPFYNKNLFWKTGLSDAGLMEAFDASEGLIMASFSEGFGLPIIEYSQTGKQIILNDIEIFREISQYSSNTIFYEKNSPESLKNIIRNLLAKSNAFTLSYPSKTRSWTEASEQLMGLVWSNNCYKKYHPKAYSFKINEKEIDNEGRNFQDLTNINVSLEFDPTPRFDASENTLSFSLKVINNSKKCILSNKLFEVDYEFKIVSSFIDFRDLKIENSDIVLSAPFALLPSKELLLRLDIPMERIISGIRFLNIGAYIGDTKISSVIEHDLYGLKFRNQTIRKSQDNRSALRVVSFGKLQTLNQSNGKILPILVKEISDSEDGYFVPNNSVECSFYQNLAEFEPVDIWLLNRNQNLRWVDQRIEYIFLHDTLIKEDFEFHLKMTAGEKEFFGVLFNKNGEICIEVRPDFTQLIKDKNDSKIQLPSLIDFADQRSFGFVGLDVTDEKIYLTQRQSTLILDVSEGKKVKEKHLVLLIKRNDEVNFPVILKIFVNGKIMSDFKLGHSKLIKTFIPLNLINGNIANIDFDLNYDNEKKHRKIIDINEINFG